MDVRAPKGSGRVRVRLEGFIDPLTQCRAFRVEDQDGKVLRRIHAARNSQEALALYWRYAGAVMPGVMMSKDLDRRISRARAGGAHQAMQTPELPFDATPSDDRSDPDADLADSDAERETGSSTLQIRRPRARRAQAALPQTELFAPETVQEAVQQALSEVHVDKLPDETRAAPAPVHGKGPRDPEPRILSADTVMLQRVDFRQLRSTDRADSYLYHITNGPDAEAALRQGLVLSASDPMILTERQGVSYWLSVLAEDYDYIMDGPADIVVLRLRRIAVAELLEPDPDATRSAGCPCYLLTGRRRNN